MNVEPLRALAVEWKDEADLFRRRGQDRLAAAAESFAEDLEERIREWELETLTLEEAAEESGFAYSTLQQKVAGGELPNAGEKRRPRIRRCDLPTKGGAEPAVSDGPDVAGEILSRIRSG